MPDTAQAVVEAPPPAPTEAYQTIFERRRTTGQAVQDVLRAYANPLYRPLRRVELPTAQRAIQRVGVRAQHVLHRLAGGAAALADRLGRLGGGRRRRCHHG